MAVAQDAYNSTPEYLPEWLRKFLGWATQDGRRFTDMMTLGLAELFWQQKDTREQVQDVIDNYDPNAEGANPYELQHQIESITSGYGWQTADQEKYVDNLIAQYNTEQNNAFQEHMRDTQQLSTAQQLAALGLSPSGVLQTSANSGVSSSPADNSFNNVAQEKYKTQQSNTSALIGLIRSMASSGIYGSAISKARGIASKMASTTASSAIAANYEAEQHSLGTASEKLINQLLQDGNFYQLNKMGIKY